ncbi:homocysteine S-methyltransferase [Aquipuribacter hungaricus]|uniref:Homocysteine S-methyltransferase n=1 Tax=Aquipuribacter hungaricus TaxID=545624 RepID=A0ABV7WL32_9MICO
MSAAPGGPAGTLAEALAARTVVLDGGLATHLQTRGHDLSGELWSASLLTDDPGAVRDAHADYLRAGAEVLVTASYQASVAGFAHAGLDGATALGLVARSVLLAREACEDTGVQAWVAGSVGPYGAVLAGGQEYTGDYVDPAWTDGPTLTVPALRAFHRERMEALAGAGADVLACETVPAATEVEALLLAAGDVGVPVWLSLTTVVDEDGVVRTRRGEEAADAFAMARGVSGVVAVGVNCCDPAGVGAAVEVAAAASGLPVVVYPNSGETWDAAARGWVGEPDLDLGAVDGWVTGGARLVGGCCRVGPDQVAQLARHLGG